MEIVALNPVATKSASPSTISPAIAQRIAGYDVARSVALLGMFVGHFAAGFTWDSTRPAWLATFLDNYLTGRQTATFFVLAGVGLTLMTRRSVASGDPQAIAQARKTLIYRGLFLLALGFATLVRVPWDILRVYGVSLLLASQLITASNRRLLLGALGAVLGFVILYLVLDFKEYWVWPSGAVPTYRHLWTPLGLVRNLFFDGYRSVFPWTGFVLFGMWLGRHDLCKVAVNNRVLLWGLCAWVFAEVISALGISYIHAHADGLDVEATEAVITTRSMPALPLFVLATGGAAVTVIALTVRLVAAWPGRHWQPLVATGQLALTWWIAHLLFLDIAQHLVLLPLARLPVASAYGVFFFAVAVLTSWLWKMVFRTGPLEWVMRKVAG
jgi:uncharacterized membrane protein YeiB